MFFTYLRNLGPLFLKIVFLPFSSSFRNCSSMCLILIFSHRSQRLGSAHPICHSLCFSLGNFYWLFLNSTDSSFCITQYAVKSTHLVFISDILFCSSRISIWFFFIFSISCCSFILTTFSFICWILWMMHCRDFGLYCLPLKYVEYYSGSQIIYWQVLLIQ